MRTGQGVRTGLGHGGITCVLQTQFSSFSSTGLVVWSYVPFSTMHEQPFEQNI